MANLERLTKRVKKLEEWIEENEDMGGPKGLLETMSFLVNEARTYGLQYRNAQEQFTNLRGLCNDLFFVSEAWCGDWQCKIIVLYLYLQCLVAIDLSRFCHAPTTTGKC